MDLVLLKGNPTAPSTTQKQGNRRPLLHLPMPLKKQKKKKERRRRKGGKRKKEKKKEGEKRKKELKITRVGAHFSTTKITFNKRFSLGLPVTT